MKKFGTKLLLTTLTVALGLNAQPEQQLTAQKTAIFMQDLNVTKALSDSYEATLAAAKNLNTTITRKGFDLGSAAYGQITRQLPTDSYAQAFVDRIASFTSSFWEARNRIALVFIAGYLINRAIKQRSVWPPYIIWGTPKNQALRAKKQLHNALIAVQRPENETKEKLTLYTEYGFIANKIIQSNSALKKANTCLFKKNATTKEYEEAKEIFEKALLSVETIYNDYQAQSEKQKKLDLEKKEAEQEKELLVKKHQLRNEIEELIKTEEYDDEDCPALKNIQAILENKDSSIQALTDTKITIELLGAAWKAKIALLDATSNQSEIWHCNKMYNTATDTLYAEILSNEDLKAAAQTFSNLNSEQSITNAKAVYNDTVFSEESDSDSDVGTEMKTEEKEKFDSPQSSPLPEKTETTEELQDSNYEEVGQEEEKEEPISKQANTEVIEKQQKELTESEAETIVSALEKANACLSKRSSTPEEYQEAKETFEKALVKVEEIYDDYQAEQKEQATLQEKEEELAKKQQLRNEIEKLIKAEEYDDENCPALKNIQAILENKDSSIQALTDTKITIELLDAAWMEKISLIDATIEQLNMAPIDAAIEQLNEAQDGAWDIWSHNETYSTANDSLYAETLSNKDLIAAAQAFSNLNSEQSITDAKAVYDNVVEEANSDSDEGTVIIKEQEKEKQESPLDSAFEEFYQDKENLDGEPVE